MKSIKRITLSIFILLATTALWCQFSSYAHNDIVTPDNSGEVVTIKAVGSTLQYETTRVELEAGTEVTIRLDNTESSMPHNLVLLKDEADIRQVGIAGLQAKDTEYVPESHSDKIIAHTALARPGETVEVTFTVPPSGEYPYVCTYPGHFQTMRGTLISTDEG